MMKTSKLTNEPNVCIFYNNHPINLWSIYQPFRIDKRPFLSQLSFLDHHNRHLVKHMFQIRPVLFVPLHPPEIRVLQQRQYTFGNWPNQIQSSITELTQNFIPHNILIDVQE